MVSLTQKQENFSLDILQGLSETAAYENHYGVNNMSKGAIYVEACRLRANPKVALRIEELRAIVSKDKVADYQERQEVLTEIVREDIISDKGVPLRHSNITAIAELNKMDGAYEPVKVDITSGLEALLGRLQGRKELPEGGEDGQAT